MSLVCKHLIIVHRYEEETVRWSSRPGFGPGPPGQQRRDVRRRPPSAPNLDEGPDDCTDHMPKKAVSGDFIRQQGVIRSPVGSPEGANRAGDLAADASERTEVM